LIELGKKELLDFASAVLIGLAEKEEEQYQGSVGAPPCSGLRLFARLDVGVLQNQTNGKWSFWLNEVKCGHCTGVFSFSSCGAVDRWAPTLVHLWEQVLSEKRQESGASKTDKLGNNQ
jgi:hypothetical protein